IRCAEAVIAELDRTPGMATISISPGTDPKDRIKIAADEVEIKHGKFNLFAFCNQLGNRYSSDIVVSAEWIDWEARTQAKAVADGIASVLQGDEIKLITGLIVLSPKHPLVAGLNQLVRVTHGKMNFTGNLNFPCMSIRLEDAII